MIKCIIERVLSFFNGIIIRCSVSKCGKNLSVHKSVNVDNPKQIVLGDSVKLHKGVKIRSRNHSVSPSINFGKNVIIHDNTYIDDYGGEIYIGDNSGIGQMCVVAGHGSLKIGKYCMIAGLTYIIPANHAFLNTEIAFANQGETKKGIVIEDNVWIGAGCVILDGIKIGSNSVVGAGSVVTKSIPSGVLACGNPAKVIKCIGIKD